MSDSKHVVFVRDATGLVRSLTWFDGLWMGLAYFSIPIAAFLIFGLGSFLFPGSNMVILVSVIGLLFDLPVMLAYSMFGAAMPRSGGDYVYVSRTISPSLGFAASVAFFLYGLTFAGGQNAYFTVTLGIAPYLAAIGSTNGNPALVNLSQTLLQPIPLMVVGSLMLVALFVFVMMPTATLHKLMLLLFIIAFIGYPILYVAALAVSSNAQFVSAFNAYASQSGINTSYNGIITQAQAAGATIAAPSFAATIAALPLAYATLGVPQSSVYIGGEIKRATRQIPIALLSCLFIIAGSTAIMGYLTYGVFGYNFISATAYYGFSGASGYPLPGSPYPDYFLAILYPNQIFNWYMLVSVVAWELLVMGLVGLVATRLLFAWAFDRVVPTAMADISDKFGTPLKAGIVTTIACFIFLALTVYNFLTSYVSLIMAQTSLYLLAMISAIVFPYLKKDMFNRSPPMVTRRVAGVPIMTLLGLLGAIALAVNFYWLFAAPAVSGVSPVSALVVVATYIVCIGAYFAVKQIRKKQGIDIGLAFNEIPPE